MDREAFWKIIESSRRGTGGDPDAQMDRLRDGLRKLDVEEILSFDGHFTELYLDAYRWDLWNAAYLAGGGCSDDGFMDFRSWLVAQGRKVYEAVLKDPDAALAKILDEGDEGQVEGFQYLAAEIWVEKTGEDYVDFPDAPGRLPPEPAGERCPDGELARRYPKLWKKFGHWH